MNTQERFPIPVNVAKQLQAQAHLHLDQIQHCSVQLMGASLGMCLQQTRNMHIMHRQQEKAHKRHISALFSFIKYLQTAAVTCYFQNQLPPVPMVTFNIHLYCLHHTSAIAFSFFSFSSTLKFQNTTIAFKQCFLQSLLVIFYFHFLKIYLHAFSVSKKE